MTITLAMFEESFEHIEQRLDALGLDIELVTFDRDGRGSKNGAPVDAGELEVDYWWLSSHVANQGYRAQAFKTALACKRVGVLQTFNAGLDAPVYKELSDRGTRICNSSAQAVAISEYVMAQVLGLIHPLETQRAQQQKQQWQLTPFRELSRMSWLVIGYGPIGQEVVKRAKAFGSKTTVVRRSPQISAHVDRCGTLADLEEYLPQSDIIVLACPLTPETRGLANAQFFASVKQDAVLVNIARGALVEDTALLESLDQGRLANAVLDVFHREPLPPGDPLWSHPKVRVTPHTSFAGDGGQDRWDQLFLDNLGRFVAGEPLQSEVDPSDIV